LWPESPYNAYGKHLIYGIRHDRSEILMDVLHTSQQSGIKITSVASPASEGWDLVGVRVYTESLVTGWVSWQEIEVFGWRL
jgi:hypothetical protein